MEITGYKEKSSHVRNGITSTVYLMDCMEGLRQMPHMPNCLAVVDPPYGINVAKMAYTQEDNRPCKQKNGATLHVKKKKYKHGDWDEQPAGEQYLIELLRVSKNQIIWGINYMDFHLKGGRIVWNKLVPNGLSFSDCEIAYCSMIERVENVYFRWAGMIQGVYCGKDIGKALIQQGNKQLNEERIHPTHKPIALYDWIYSNYSKPNDLILDTHLGSGSSRIAACKAKLNFIGFEIDKDYFHDQEKRFKVFTSQQRIIFN
jgi:site-specific DNA-methyltransferase (adenine-specific)